MEELNIRDLEELAKAGISITFTKLGMIARKDTDDVVINNCQIDYEILYHLDMDIHELIDVWFPAEKEDE